MFVGVILRNLRTNTTRLHILHINIDTSVHHITTEL